MITADANQPPSSPAERAFDAARRGDAPTLARLLDATPDLLLARLPPYSWSLLHVAAAEGHLPIVELLLARGADVNDREAGDNSYAMHWAAAAGHVDVLRRLADAGGDVVGAGDDHDLEVIGWATCWSMPHRSAAEFLVSRGARHHIFSAVAMGLSDEVRTIVAGTPGALNRRMSCNEEHRLPLHHAVARNLPEMVALLIELGADPLGVDRSGHPAAVYATGPDVDRPVMAAILRMTLAEIVSADRGARPVRATVLDLLAALAMKDWGAADRVVGDRPALVGPAGSNANSGALHLMSKRGDTAAVSWLLQHGADPSGLWPHWDAQVTPLHLAAANGHEEVIGLLLDAGADRTIRDSQHDSDPLGWATFFEQPGAVRRLTEGSANAR